MLTVFITAAYPSVDKSIQALQILIEEELDCIEFGVPFSDPLADGPVIQNASFQALKNGANIDKIFEIISEAKNRAQKSPKNLLLFTYYNPVYNYGIEKLAIKCKEYGVSGLLIPDLPVNEAEEVRMQLKEHDLNLTLLASITSTDERLKKIAELSEPFVYLVSRVGITGSSQDISKFQINNSEEEQELLVKEKIKKIKAFAPGKIVGLGFGIDSLEKVKASYAIGADMAIIGTKAIRILESDSSEDLTDFRAFLREIKDPALH